MQTSNKKVVGNYIYGSNDIIGNGSWGTVYRGSLCCSSEIKSFAIKRINKYKIQANEKSMDKYISEVIALHKAGKIPEIIKFIDFFKSKSHYYLVTQYHQNTLDLFQYMKIHKNKFCQTQAKQIWRQLLKGIKALHDLNIYHRDLKLQNIVYGQGKTYIIDFGTATCLPNQIGLVGSPLFMSPQIMQGHKYTKKCDTWSLGIIFYYMLFHQPPFGQQMDPKKVLTSIIKFKNGKINYPNRKFISEGAKQVIESCLKYDESKRMEIRDILKLPFFINEQIPKEIFNFHYQSKISFKH